jgi:Reverse transcriptase (RNA-dependent DNA polymerase)
VFGQDYTNTYSPAAKFTSIRTLLAITTQLGLKVHQLNVDTAFLNAPTYEDIWFKVPDGTPSANRDTGIYKLRKALYGAKQAPREWNNHVDKFLVTKLGFRRLEADPCIYKKTVLKEMNGVMKVRFKSPITEIPTTPHRQLPHLLQTLSMSPHPSKYPFFSPIGTSLYWNSRPMPLISRKWYQQNLPTQPISLVPHIIITTTTIMINIYIITYF